MSINIGLIGAGRIGTVHALNLASGNTGANLLAIADIDRKATEALAAQHQVGWICSDYRDLLNSDNIDAVFICSSTPTHAEYSLAALAAGKHVFCEKPVDLDLAKVTEVVEAVEASSQVYFLGFNRRYDRNFRHLQERLQKGELGKPQILRITSRDPAPPPISYIKSSGGIFLDMTIHDFDMARFVMGREVREVYARGAVLIDPAIGKAGDIDTVLITLTFDDGTIGTIDNCRQAVYGYDQRVEVLAEKGMISAENELENQTRIQTAERVSSAKPMYFFLERYLEAYRRETIDFIDCITNDRKAPVSAVDGLAALKIGLAAGRSIKENRPVRLDEI